MEKKIIYLLILSLLSFSLVILPNVHAEPICNVINLITDKNYYYYHESINLSATWETNYNDEEEYLYVQLRIFDQSETLRWNSSKYDQKGIIAQNWTITIQYLNLTFPVNPCLLTIKFYRYYDNQYWVENEGLYLESLNISIAKSNVGCELEGFKSDISFGENLEFKAKFYYLSNLSEIRNQTIKFLIKSDNTLIFQQNHSSNLNGTISLYISTSINLRFGNNLLIFEILNLPFINNSIFQYMLIVSKSKIYIEIIEFEEEVSLDDLLEIKLKFYYLNNTIYPLKNQYIFLNIYQNICLIYDLLLSTNSTGELEIFLNPSNFAFNKINTSYYIVISFNGTNYFENASISLHLTITESNNDQIDSFVEVFIISLTSILAITTTLILSIKYYKKRESCVKLKDITFKI